MTSLLSLNNRYAGLTHTAKQIGHHFIKSKYYIECFSGLARTAKYATNCEIMILNDISEFSNKKIKSPYSKLVIHTHSRLFGNKPKTMMFSNKPLEIQIPQIIDYV